ncbi:2-amino-4-hydroxy-6-hydroxymethyldihydropteridine diphosphokinase [Ancylomarina sp. 16SWW S1-10-2]|uniref:2-amino-4-hydroxy-6- hydroxymethyldihydropteridine diphosphokinase n=1 Tax=Ancylomarina sp. 16SWW S1-10-2 TaxID=2499681 RepID=UPI0012AE0214|nr:2-amino-4-hydroxy-6-hydroxymethyldihydropteridine diphosphokinase [Ancylomarina sp. 16SWW S1-10-2]MRT92207.1 2-amino-4-hydroxy-6-hydroxymethyldihydropteridine diphosphokinase [Ancylomarina sp. 16SWW S1-10-2]
MTRIYFLLGGNIGNREEILSEAIKKMTKQLGKFVQTSALYETEPWGFTHEQNFLNQVVVFDSELSPLDILDKTQIIEKELGRVRKTTQYCERTIDIDILFYGDECIENQRLSIPHPRIQERSFALYPLEELIPEFIHPKLKKSIQLLKDECSDKLKVNKFR